MKKSLLFLVAVAFALNASAQFNAAEKTVQPKAISSQDRLAAAQVVAGQKKARKSPANGVQYARPAGTFFDNWSKEGSGYYASFLVVPPLTDISFADISTAEGDRVWTNNGNEYPAEEDGSFDFGSLPAHDASTGDGPDTYYIPTLTIGETAFALQGAGSGKSSSYGTYASYLAVETLTTISLYDCHNINYYVWGA